jgi:hypothetical protein
MTTTTTSAALIPVAPTFTNTERLALAAFLAGYSGLTRQATSWTCANMRAGATSTTWLMLANVDVRSRRWACPVVEDDADPLIVTSRRAARTSG